jgi:polyphosphate kinase
MRIWRQSTGNYVEQTSNIYTNQSLFSELKTKHANFIWRQEEGDQKNVH